MGKGARVRNRYSRAEARQLPNRISWREWERRVENLLIANYFDVEHQKPLKTKEDNQRSHKRGKSDFVGVGLVGSPSEGKVAILEAKTGSGRASKSQLANLERWSKVPGVIACGVYYPVDYPRLVKELGGRESLS